MAHIKETREIEVYHSRGDAMTLKEIETFCAKAREAGFDDKAKPWTGDQLIYKMSLNRSEAI